jgi:hypothetical protein
MNKLYFSLLVAITILISGCANPLISESDESVYFSSLQKGDALAQAINKYYQVEQSYPDDLAVLVPKYIDAIPVPNRYFSDFLYLVYGKQEWYKGKPKYSLNLSKKTGFTLIWPNSHTLFKYDPDSKVVNNKKTDVHFRQGNWVYITRYRHAVGEASRIE